MCCCDLAPNFQLFMPSEQLTAYCRQSLHVWDAAVQQWMPTCYVQSADGLFTFHGTCQPDASWTGNNIKLQVKGHKQIDFHDGGQVDIISPIQYIKGELRGKWLQTHFFAGVQGSAKRRGRVGLLR